MQKIALFLTFSLLSFSTFSMEKNEITLRILESYQLGYNAGFVESERIG